MIYYRSQNELRDEIKTISANYDRVVILGDYIKQERMLIDTIENALESPYDKDNWDGFLDAVTDLTWLEDRKLAIIHTSLPALSKKHLKIYVEIIDIANRYWESFDQQAQELIETIKRERDEIPEDCWIYKKKIVDYYFPEEDYQFIETIRKNNRI